MDNRIRQIRKERGLTLAGLADRCVPPTTAQTIGRLETGMRTLSLAWLDRIATALDIPPAELIVEAVENSEAHLTARLGPKGISALDRKQAISVPHYGSHVRLVNVEGTVGEYRDGDLLWFETIKTGRLHEAVNRTVLLPGRAGDFHLGRLAGVSQDSATLLSLTPGTGAETVSGYEWVAILRKLIRNFG